MRARVLVTASATAVALVAAACTASGHQPAAFELTATQGAPDILATPGGVVWSVVSNTGPAPVLRSTDAGRTWRVVLTPPRRFGLTASYFLGADDAWVIGSRAQPGTGRSSVLGTSDGGSRWWRSRPLPGDNSGAYQIFFSDSHRGWILGSGIAIDQPAFVAVQLWHTADGGHDWQLSRSSRLPLQGAPDPGPPDVQCQPAIAFSSQETGLFSDGSCQPGARRPEVWRTSDGGNHWHPAALAAPTGAWRGGGTPGTPRVVATGRRGAFLVPVADGPSGLVIEKSSDGGLTWHIASQLDTGAGPAVGSPAGWFYPVTARRWVISAPGRLIETADGGKTWHFLVSAESLPGIPASFTTLDTGYLQGTGLVAAMASNNAGRTWTAQPAPPSAATSPSNFGGPAFSLVQLVSPRFAVAAGWDGLLTSADGGRTWTRRVSVPPPVSEIKFVTTRVGFAVANGELLRTLDGGARWQAIPQPAAGPVQSVDFWSAHSGVAFLLNPGYFITRDAGVHWQPLRLPAGWSIGPNGLAIGPDGIGSPVSASVCFAADGTGWAVGRHHGRAVLVSIDGGRHWRVALPSSALPQSAPDDRNFSMAGCDGQTAWVVVSSELNQYDSYDTTFDLLRTTDLGRSWLDVLRADNQRAPRPQVPSLPGGPPFTGNPYGHYGPILLQLSVPAPLTAWATECAFSQGGCMNLGLGLTADGGLSWRSIWYTPSGLGRPVRGPFPAGGGWIDTSALDMDNVWLLFQGPSAISYVYGSSDGGATWHRVTVFAPAAPASG